MKGLILKEIYCVRFQTLLGLAITAIPSVMMLLLGDITGEIPSGAEGAAIIATIPVVLSNFMMILLSSSFMLNTLNDDKISGWAKLQLTLPVTRKQIIDTKFIASLVIIGFLMLICLVLNLTAALLYNYPLEICIAAPFVFGFTEMMVLFPAFPMSMKLSAAMNTVVYITLEVIVMGLLTAIAFCALDAVVPMWFIRVLFYGIIPALGIAVMLISRHFAAKYISAEQE